MIRELIEIIMSLFNTIQGRIQDFKLGGGGALKKIVPSGGRYENVWCISCEKSLDPPLLYNKTVKLMIKKA
jgi:hypothetical protein